MSPVIPIRAPRAPEIGILDLQGGIQEHLDHLERLGIDARRIKTADALSDVAGLILPGGESTCIARLLAIFGLDQVILREDRQGMKLWRTCAGTILVAKTLVGEPAHLGLIDITVERNGFGSQLDSFAAEAVIPKVSPDPIPLTFIRAPKITHAGPGVEILLQIDDYIAAAESSDVLVTVFHPELTPCLALHHYFACKCGLIPQETGGPVLDPSWKTTSWTRLARLP
ncbi:MAG: pyridoxal 5'-phosphate synthase glutaminase subunit PdxT [Syntrophales bacterium]